MERERNYALEVCDHLRRRLVDERTRPLGLGPVYDFHAEDVRLEPGVNGEEIVVMFRVRGRNRLLGYREGLVLDPEWALAGRSAHEIVELHSAEVLTNLVEDLDTGTISKPDVRGVSWVEPRRRRGRPGRSYPSLRSS